MRFLSLILLVALGVSANMFSSKPADSGERLQMSEESDIVAVKRDAVSRRQTTRAKVVQQALRNRPKRATPAGPFYLQDTLANNAISGYQPPSGSAASSYSKITENKGDPSVKLSIDANGYLQSVDTPSWVALASPNDTDFILLGAPGNNTLLGSQGGRPLICNVNSSNQLKCTSTYTSNPYTFCFQTSSGGLTQTKQSTCDTSHGYNPANLIISPA